MLAFFLVHMSLRKDIHKNCSNCPSYQHGIFCDLEKASLDKVSDTKITNVFKKGQTLFVQDNPPFGLYCISKGNIKVTKTDSNGKESIVRLAKKGDVLGHRSIFTNQFYSATATALEDTVVCFLDKKFIINLVKNEPTVAMKLIERLGKDMGVAEGKISSFHQKSVRERVAEFLLLLKEGHGEIIEDGRTKLNIKLSRDEMASIVGTATETLIRIISELKKDKVIDQESKVIFIKDEEALLEIANTIY